MNKRQWVKLYMLEKNQMIQDITGMNLYDDRDYEWAEKLQYIDVVELHSSLKFESDCSLTYVSDFYSGGFCPQCIVSQDCFICNYGQNHGVCSKNCSEYQAIRSKILRSIGKLDKQYTIALKNFIKWNKVI